MSSATAVSLDDGFIDWCLRQDFIDPYYRKGLACVIDKRYPKSPEKELGVAGCDEGGASY
jgi:hypothetical protein